MCLAKRENSSSTALRKSRTKLKIVSERIVAQEAAGGKRWKRLEHSGSILIVTVFDLLVVAPAILQELTTEFALRADPSLSSDKTSQTSACFMLALRCSSLLVGAARLLDPATWDSFDVVPAGLYGIQRSSLYLPLR